MDDNQHGEIYILHERGRTLAANIVTYCRSLHLQKLLSSGNYVINTMSILFTNIKESHRAN